MPPLEIIISIMATLLIEFAGGHQMLSCGRCGWGTMGQIGAKCPLCGMPFERAVAVLPDGRQLTAVRVPGRPLPPVSVGLDDAALPVAVQAHASSLDQLPRKARMLHLAPKPAIPAAG